MGHVPSCGAMSTDAKDQTKASTVFREVIDLLEDGNFDYVVGGGIATDYWTDGPKVIRDIDIVVREDDADAILRELERRGYATQRMEDSWLHKAFSEDVTIDLIFELKNGVRFDDLLKKHRSRGDMFGTTCYVLAAEDQIPSLAAAIDNETIGQHWYNVLKLMANVDLDWDYILVRSERVARRMLSVVHFAIDEQVPVAEGVIERLTELAVTSG